MKLVSGFINMTVLHQTLGGIFINMTVLHQALEGIFT